MKGEVDERTGVMCNLDEVERLVNDMVIEYLDHHHLNPTAENIAREIGDRLDENPGSAKLHRIRLYETARNIADYYGPAGEDAPGTP